MERLHNLFIRHLRLVYDGEKMLAKTFAAMSLAAHSKALERFYITCQVEKERHVKMLLRVFAILRTSAEGEQDAIVRTYVNEQAGNERENIQAAQALLGRAMNIYLVNAYKTAISCARELDVEDVGEILEECLAETKFSRERIEFLENELVREEEARGVAA